MIIAIVGSGGKTTLLKKLAAQYRQAGKTVFLTTTTRMFIEPDTLLTDDPQVILQTLRKKGFAFAGVPEGCKIKALSPETFSAAASFADVTIVEADGSKQLPLKYPNQSEPVIPAGPDKIIVVCGLHGISKQAKDVCHRLELVKRCLGIEDDTLITPRHVQQLVTEGYLKPLRKAYPGTEVTLYPTHDGSPYLCTIAQLLRQEQEIGPDL